MALAAEHVVDDVERGREPVREHHVDRVVPARHDEQHGVEEQQRPLHAQDEDAVRLGRVAVREQHGQRAHGRVAREDRVAAHARHGAGRDQLQVDMERD